MQEDCYILPCVKQIASGNLLYHTGSSVLCEDLDGMLEGHSKREGIYASTELTHFIVQQKLAQQCKAIIPQPKKCRKQTGARPWTTAWLAWSYVMSRYKSLASGKDWLAQRTDSLSRELAVKVPEWVVGRIWSARTGRILLAIWVT